MYQKCLKNKHLRVNLIVRKLVPNIRQGHPQQMSFETTYQRFFVCLCNEILKEFLYTRIWNQVLWSKELDTNVEQRVVENPPFIKPSFYSRCYSFMWM